MGIFERQRVTIESNDIQYIPGTRKPLSDYSLFAEHVPCTITAISSNTNTVPVMFILKRQLDKIGALPRKGYKVTLDSLDPLDNKIEYRIKDEPIWSGGIKHHIECTLEQLV